MRNINLLPIAHRPQPKFELRRFAPVLIGTVIVLGLALALIVLQITISNSRGLIKTKNNHIKILETKLDNMSEVASIDRMIKKIDEIESENISTIEIMDDIEDFMPRDMILTQLNISKTAISIQGEANELKHISDFLDSLNNWEQYSQVAISQISSSGEKLIFNIEAINGGGEE